MALVPAICTQCGAAVEVDDTKDAAICKYCGTPFIVEKAIKNYNTYITTHNDFNGATINIQGADINNLLGLAQSAIDTNNGKEALDYSNRALEIDNACANAWIMKMKATSLTATVGDQNYLELFTYGNNAIKYANDEDKEDVTHTVNAFYLDFAYKLMINANDMVRDVGKLKQMKRVAGLSVSVLSTVLNIEAQTRAKIEQLAVNAINLKNTISEDIILKDEELREKVKKLVECYKLFCYGDVLRRREGSVEPDRHILATYSKNMNLLKKGLLESEKKEDKIEKCPFCGSNNIEIKIPSSAKRWLSKLVNDKDYELEDKVYCVHCGTKIPIIFS